MTLRLLSLLLFICTCFSTARGEVKGEQLTTLLADMPQRPLNIAFTAYPPYSWKERDKVMGIHIETLNYAIQEQLGVKIKHNFFPWKRAQKLVEKGEMDALSQSKRPLGITTR